jgi:lipoprotein
MLKLKITVTALALVSLDLIIIGDTCLTASAAIACTAMALPLAGYLAWRWQVPDDNSRIPFILWVPVAELPVIRAFKELGVMSTPLGATIEPEKMTTLGGFVALTSTIAILLAVIVPSSPTRDDSDDED